MPAVALIYGARPNYMKMFPLWRCLRAQAPHITPLLIHTGQHYDRLMSKVFFDELGMPRPDLSLGIGSGSHADQTGRLMMALESALTAQPLDLVVVVGDVNSTLAAALVAAKQRLPVAHIEAGLRSFDRRMPEEINRVVTDALSDLLFTSCRDADDNLRREGVSADKIHFVGNLMIDCLKHFLPQAETSDVLARLALTAGAFACVTLHRPANVDDPDRLADLLDGLEQMAESLDVIFPVHPRTRACVTGMGWKSGSGRVRLVEPQGYLDFVKLLASARLVVTDSGGIQEETSWLGVPCLTARENTERPITLTEGTNRLIPPTGAGIVRGAADVFAAASRPGRTDIEYWDGETASRIVTILTTWLAAR